MPCPFCQKKDYVKEFPAGVVEAIENTPSAKITPEGISLDISRYQKEEQAGEQSVRTGVFYLPELKSPYRKYHTTDKHGYGGEDVFTGHTVICNPIIVKAGTGGKGVERAYDMVEGKDAYQKMRSDVLSTIYSGAYRRVQIEDIEQILEKYGGKTELAWNIFEYSREGNTLPYAIQEHIAAVVLRNAGYDSVLCYSIHEGSPRLSELFDLRQECYLMQGG